LIPPDREFLDGAEAIARGALDAGCNFFAGYPITPASGILAHMLRELPEVGGTGIQGEDEIASIGFCIGAALAGARPMTASSGPGLALYAENLGVGVMVEVPLVVVIVQRLGPATGAATAGGQGDIQTIRWVASGGYPIIALAPTDVAECYHLTRRAFALAERFRVPVFIATDKEVVMTADTVPAAAFREPPAWWPPVPEGPFVAPLVPYGPVAPRDGVTGGARGRLLRYNASSHDEHGDITKDPVVLDRLNRRLASKIEDHVDALTLVGTDLQPGARTLLVSYGVSAQSMREAVAQIRGAGGAVSALTPMSLWPVPETAIREAAEGADRIVVIELNLGQYRREIERLVPRDVDVRGVNRVDGELIAPEEIVAAAQA
jgi:2-oxoglutarate/2-oxoacid ferredoxin oxidoreductase subunit alpha